MANHEFPSERGEEHHEPEQRPGDAPWTPEDLRGENFRTFDTALQGLTALDHTRTVIKDITPYIPFAEHTHSDLILHPDGTRVQINTTYESSQLQGARFVEDVLRSGDIRGGAGAIGSALAGAAHYFEGISATGGRLDVDRALSLLVKADGQVVAYRVEPGLTGFALPHPETRREGQLLVVLDGLARVGQAAARLRNLAPHVGLELGQELGSVYESLGKAHGQEGARHFRGLEADVVQAIARGDEAFFYDYAKELRLTQRDQYPDAAVPIRDLATYQAQVTYIMLGQKTELGVSSQATGLILNAENGLRVVRSQAYRRAKAAREGQNRDIETRLGIEGGWADGNNTQRPEHGRGGTTRGMGGRAIDLSKNPSSGESGPLPAPSDRDRE